MTPKPDLKRALQGSGYDVLGADGRVRVLVELREPDDSAVERLSALGLVVEGIAGKTLLGTIAQNRLATLRQDDAVVAVERSVPLRPTTP